jgi:hypothetical protein
MFGWLRYHIIGRYANEPAFSDDDMEANASDVLREEKRRYSVHK